VRPLAVTAHPALMVVWSGWARQLCADGVVTGVSTTKEKANRRATLEAVELTRVTDRQ
jgi:hypothetical protein